MARTNVSVSASKLRLITSAIPSSAASRMATYGVLNRGWTFAMESKNSPSSAMAKKTRGEASMLPFSELNDEIITNTETSTTPVWENSAIIVSAATSGVRGSAIPAIGMT